MPYIIAINKFSTDTTNEVEALYTWCKENEHPVAEADGWANGGEGMKALAELVVNICEKENDFHFIYEDEESIEDKIEKIAKTIYGADGVEYSDNAKEKIKLFNQLGWDKLPICMAKTPLSLSDVEKKKGRPKDFTIHVQDLSISRGAGFVVVYTGSILTMPGLPKEPAAMHMGIDEKGKSFGLF